MSESESEPTGCSRCGRALGPEVTSVAIERGPLHETDPTLRLCRRCTESFKSWLRKYQRARSSGQQAPSGPAPPEGHRRTESHHRHRRDRGRRALWHRALFLGGLIAGALAVLGYAAYLLFQEILRR